MSRAVPEITAIDPKRASDADFERLAVLRNILLTESRPDDPPSSAEDVKLRLLNIPPVFEFHGWVTQEGSEFVGEASVVIPHMETNQHICQFDIAVHPDHRRHSIGTALLGKIVPIAERDGRNLLVGETRSTVPPGEEFMEAIGATIGLATHANDLRVADLNRDLIRDWLDRAPDRAVGFRLVEWIGRYPDDQIEAVVKMMESINLMPTDDLKIEDFHWTPEQVRQMDDAMEAQGMERWTIVAVEESTGRLAGYSELLFNPRKPTLADQGATAVFSEYQNRGLGRWLKAAMLEKLVTERSAVERIRTGNAHSNAPMLKINDELGFKPSMTTKYWQAELPKVQEYLASRAVAVTVA
ncbi:MAG TPA: GNAT family N-acetyltransferase [Chloroflexota bacterium]|jgi:GNAT superfamily N-acetyltransferase|nr:GNAT family N-acetyltransferase [Chloroflexota bacterium]